MLQTVFHELTVGFGMTLELFALTLVGAIPLGLVVAFGSMTKIKPIKYVTRLFVWVMRGTPLMLQLIIVYYGPGLVFGTNVWGMGSTGRFAAVLVAFIINYSAYFSEIYRGGIESIPQGQYEAGQMLGFTKSQIFFKIILLQVVKRIIPPMSNEIINLVKDTSLVYSVSYIEMFALAKQIAAANTTVMPFFIAGVFYYIFNFVVAWVMEWFERKLDYYR